MTDIAAVVAAAASSRGIGSGGDLVWRIPADMSHFKKVTMTPPPSIPSSVEGAAVADAASSPSVTNAVIMGRKTWESIPSKFRPLEDRMNIILSRSPSYIAKVDESNTDADIADDENVIVCKSLKDAMTALNKRKEKSNDLGQVFVIGGGEVYKESIESGLVNRVVYTMVDNLSQEQEDSFDAWFPELSTDEWVCSPFPGQEKVEKENAQEEKKEDEEKGQSQFHKDAIVQVHQKSGAKFQFLEYHRKKKNVKKEDKNDTVIEEGAHMNPEEMQYLKMCRDIIENGVERGDRTGTGTLSQFGTQMRFSLRDGTLPLLTTKRTFWRGVAEELLWFVKVNK
jgi:dihydrofolate reductase/thymidylate synthase